ncbi:MAG TPA: hypothetical protein EYP10_11390, partial [Armatimonadetes bacterium]|nr:hypothetical protein [Armatimonadota bacterium]
CDTPTNWTTIATGATTATHCATSFNPRLPGESLETGIVNRGRGFLSTHCNAEYIWEVADRSGLRTLMVNYLVGYPTSIKNGVMVNGSGVPPHQLADGVRFATHPKRDEVEINLSPQSLPEGISSKKQSFGATLRIESAHLSTPVELKVWVIATGRRGYNRVVICADGCALQILRRGEWSDWIRIPCRPASEMAGKWTFGWMPWQPKIQTDVVYGYLRVRLDELNASSDGVQLTLQTTPLWTLLDWVHPQEIGEMLLTDLNLGIGEDIITVVKQLSKRTPYLVSAGEEFRYLDAARAEAGRLAAIVNYIHERFGWHLCMLHFHVLDGVNHRFLAQFCPESHWHSKEAVEQALEHHRRGYQVVDELVGMLMRTVVDEKTTVIIVSDHAALPSWRMVEIRNAFVRTGLLAYRWDEQRKRLIVDWNRTRAFPYSEPPYVWVNLKGRDPFGIVDDAEYEHVRDEIIECLLSIRDPETGKRAVQLALRREEAGFLGQGGPMCGDVIYFLAPPFQFWDGKLEDFNHHEPPLEALGRPDVYPSQTVTGSHVYYLPTARVGEFTNNSILILSGAGIRKDAQVNRMVWLTDVAPTIAVLLDIEPPRQCEGCALTEVLEVRG